MKHIHRASWREEAPELKAAKEVLKVRAAAFEAAVVVQDETNQMLVKLERAAQAMTTTNSGWSTYAVARLILEETRLEKFRRVRVALIAAGFLPL